MMLFFYQNITVFDFLCIIKEKKTYEKIQAIQVKFETFYDLRPPFELELYSYELPHAISDC